MDTKTLLDPKYPLLEKFRSVAPGTFQHCKNVSNLCESISLELKLDTDLMILVGMYHDIGKMNYPEAFSENQNGGNLHDDLEPIQSYHIITKHVGDSILILLKEEDIDRKALEIISQHHGNTILRYFRDKANTNIDDIYRYKCDVPQTTEAAVLMICDSVEATARSLFNNKKLDTSEDRKKVVASTINRLVEDDQLDNMKVGDLKTIKIVLYKELENIYHKRELYEDDEEKNGE